MTTNQTSKQNVAWNLVDTSCSLPSYVLLKEELPSDFFLHRFFLPTIEKYINRILQFVHLHICLPLLNTMPAKLICVVAFSRNSFFHSYMIFQYWKRIIDLFPLQTTTNNAVLNNNFLASLWTHIHKTKLNIYYLA